MTEKRKLRYLKPEVFKLGNGGIAYGESCGKGSGADDCTTGISATGGSGSGCNYGAGAYHCGLGNYAFGCNIGGNVGL